jgi:hypothetical protein
MATNNFAFKDVRKDSIYRYVKEDGVVANCINKAGAGSVFRVVCDICGQGFKGKKQAYKHLETLSDVVLENKSGALDHFKGATIGSSNNMVGASIVSVSEY